MFTPQKTSVYLTVNHLLYQNYKSIYKWAWTNLLSVLTMALILCVL